VRDYKNLFVAVLSLALVAQIGSWFMWGRPQFQVRVVDTFRLDLGHIINTAHKKGWCVPKHVLLQADNPMGDRLDPDVLALLASRCEEVGVAFHDAPTIRDLACDPGKCGDCLGYAQQVRFDTPFVSSVYTHFFRENIYWMSYAHWYVWWLGSWHDVSPPPYPEDWE
jgi:hypothetical protein